LRIIPWAFSGSSSSGSYRTSHQIRTQADRLLEPVVTDVDGNDEDRGHTVSVFNGPPPLVRVLKDEAEEAKAVADWIGEQSKAGMLPHELGVFVRSTSHLESAKAAVASAGLTSRMLDETLETASGQVSIGTCISPRGSNSAPSS
jgi:hypothetical protein